MSFFQDPPRWLFGLTVFLAAFLLFLVQPILGKMILPWFGGSAGVWAVCLLFFQTSLLAGYAYAHGLRRFLHPRRQFTVHIILLMASFLWLPILPSSDWRHLNHLDPAIRILGLLAGTTGLPYLLISATGPLLQSWFAEFHPGNSAYRFYALSNVGSFLGLICFPLMVEPRLTSTGQAWGWSGVYMVFVMLSAGICWTMGKKKIALPVPNLISRRAAEHTPSMTDQGIWIGLAACGSALMMAVTNQLSQNLAPIPLLWILPLGLYLISFVLCFDTAQGYHRKISIPALLMSLGAMAYILFNDYRNILTVSIPTMLAGLFFGCLVCHGELARRKPDTLFLTKFYLLLSLGGVLGGAFVALAAPVLFKTYAELPICMAACGGIASAIVWKEMDRYPRIRKAGVRAAVSALCLALCVYLAVHKRQEDKRYRLQVRDFYGMLQVRDEFDPDDGRVRILMHGTIQHGAQLQQRAYHLEPTLYYLRTSGVGMALKYLQGRTQLRVGAIGLGAGVLASYCRAADIFRFYEINPEVVDIAKSQFTFLGNCAGQWDFLLGDARITLEKQEPQHFDLLAVDAFSGDAIPVHLLTREAFGEYFRHLKPDGILAVHVSNMYLDLIPIVAGLAREEGKTAIAVFDDGQEGRFTTRNDWVLISGQPAVFK
ncbi:MAG TPA: fused MFS/spermidine synthase, partial [Thermodesulfobacteriota bacterium]|nr:fused MFS/spermidine synthase [Thermodesulfobacteriota bacterium]